MVEKEETYVEKRDSYVQIFMGTTYKIGNPRTVRDLRSVLEEIVKDLPDDDLELEFVNLHEGELDYCLKEGIPQ